MLTVHTGGVCDTAWLFGWIMHVKQNAYIIIYQYNTVHHGEESAILPGHN